MDSTGAKFFSCELNIFHERLLQNHSYGVVMRTRRWLIIIDPWVTEFRRSRLQRFSALQSGSGHRNRLNNVVQWARYSPVLQRCILKMPRQKLFKCECLEWNGFFYQWGECEFVAISKLRVVYCQHDVRWLGNETSELHYLVGCLQFSEEISTTKKQLLILFLYFR